MEQIESTDEVCSYYDYLQHISKKEKKSVSTAWRREKLLTLASLRTKKRVMIEFNATEYLATKSRSEIWNSVWSRDSQRGKTVSDDIEKQALKLIIL